MKLQEFFKYDPKTVGLEGIFHSTEDGYFLNSSCLLSRFQILKPNQIYLLFSRKDEASEEISYVQLLDLFYEDGFINLYIRDIETQTTNVISHYLASNYLVHEFKIVELSFLMELLKDGYSFDFKNQTSTSEYIPVCLPQDEIDIEEKITNLNASDLLSFNNNFN